MIEFLAIGVGMLVPLAYIVLAAAGVQQAVFASTQAVREAGRAFVTAASPAQGHERAAAAALLAFDDHGLALPADALRIGCVDAPCLTPGSTVVVQVQWRVPLPWLPESFAGASPSLVPIIAEHRVPVDEYRSVPA